MNTLPRRTIAFAVLFAFACVACEEPARYGTNSNSPAGLNTNSANANTNSAAAPTPPAKAPDAWAVTLPVLAAFLADDEFLTNAKSELKLTDQQVQRLEEVSYNAAAELQESEETTGDRSPESEFRKKADSEIKQIIGEEKGARLLALVAEKWSGSEPPGVRVGPGVVPSDTRIVVNIPAFRMDLFDSGRLIKSYKVGIGYPEFPLPTGLRHAKEIIFNPPWTPPDSPWVEKMGSKIQSGKTIKPGSRLNPLGLLKVPIGFASLIHGGKPLSKIGNYASHGCVGLTNSQVTEFAQFLARMGGAELTEQQIAQYGKDRTKSHTVKLANPVPVELRYDTIVLEGGNLHIYPDVYYRGTNTEQSLRSALEFQGVPFEQLNESERAQALSALQQMNAEMPGGDPGGSAATDSSANGESRNSPANIKNARYASRKKGRGRLPKEIVVPTPNLNGRGYPNPVDLNTGTAARARLR